ncbi:hypothetical protein GCS73_10955 [Legionella longbeachae]|nr:hypothetical protein B0B39_04565 [Legionella longbeachae]QIN34074.1 hypothetical protein GCB94_11950 [Legionella longbeachae]QIN37403.1 hypothetical protein GCS73_10955 [Legionella longbeachae]HBD7398750.1 hypothetical protein [Legionella pneumophila]
MNKKSPLHVVELLLKHGADPNGKDWNSTVFYNILFANEDAMSRIKNTPYVLNVANLLLKNGAQINEVSIWNKSSFVVCFEMLHLYMKDK